MIEARPFSDNEDVHAKAETVWEGLNREDWLEAFEHHPKIGERKPTSEKISSTKGWAAEEQAGTAQAATKTLDELHHLNLEYFNKFGFIFIVCATGKSADEMLQLLRERFSNTAEEEIEIAAGEQLKITKLRLEKL